MNVLGLIPARKGSKRIPDKNLQLVTGRSLVERAIICAKFATTLGLIVVSSDDERVKAIADAHRVPFLMRPAELAQDGTPMDPVIAHALDRYDGFDAVCILEPPATFRRSNHIDTAVELLAKSRTGESVRTVSFARPADRFIHRLRGGKYLDPVYPEAYREGLALLYFRDNGIANVVRVGAPLFGSFVLPMLVNDGARGLDIDTPEDLAYAQKVAAGMDFV